MIEDAAAAAEHRARAGPAFAISALGVVLVAVCMRQAVAGIPPVLGDLGLDPGLSSHCSSRFQSCASASGRWPVRQYVPAWARSGPS